MEDDDERMRVGCPHSTVGSGHRRHATHHMLPPRPARPGPRTDHRWHKRITRPPCMRPLVLSGRHESARRDPYHAERRRCAVYSLPCIVSEDTTHLIILKRQLRCLKEDRHRPLRAVDLLNHRTRTWVASQFSFQSPGVTKSSSRSRLKRRLGRYTRSGTSFATEYEEPCSRHGHWFLLRPRIQLTPLRCGEHISKNGSTPVEGRKGTFLEEDGSIRRCPPILKKTSSLPPKRTSSIASTPMMWPSISVAR